MQVLDIFLNINKKPLSQTRPGGSSLLDNLLANYSITSVDIGVLPCSDFPILPRKLA
jgi:hypothetical protein